MKTGKALGHQNLSNIKIFLKSIDRKEETARMKNKKSLFFFLGHTGYFQHKHLNISSFIPRVYHMEYTTLTNFYLRKKKNCIFFSRGRIENEKNKNLQPPS